MADTVLLEGFGFDPPSQIPTHGVWRSQRATCRPAARRRRVLPGPPRGREHPVRHRPVRRASRPRGADTVAVWCYSLRGDAGPTGARPAGRPGARRPDHHRAGHRRRRPPAPASRVAPAGSTATTGTPARWPRSTCRSSRRRRRASRSPTGWTTRRGLGPYDATAGIAIPEFDGRVIAPVFAFNEVVDDGDELGNVVRAYRTVPDRVARVAGLAAALRPAPAHAAGRAPRGDRAERLPDQAQPARQRRRARHAGVGDARSSTRWPPTATASTVARPDGDELMAELADGLTYDAEHLSPAQLAAALGRARRRPLQPVVRHPARRRARRARAVVGPGAGPPAHPRRRARVQRPRPRQRARRHPAAPRLRRRPGGRVPLAQPAARPPLPGLLPLARRGLGRRRHRPPRQARHARVAAGQGPRAVGRLLARRRPRRRARSSTRSSSTTRARAPRPSGARTRWSSTTCCRR